MGHDSDDSLKGLGYICLSIYREYLMNVSGNLRAPIYLSIYLHQLADCPVVGHNLDRFNNVLGCTNDNVDP